MRPLAYTDKIRPQARSSSPIYAILGSHNWTGNTINHHPRQWTISTLTGLLACAATDESTLASKPSTLEADELAPSMTSHEREAHQNTAGSPLSETSREHRASPAAPGRAAADAPPPAPTTDPTRPHNLAWKHVRFAEADMQLNIIDSEHSTHAWPKGGVLQQVFDLEGSEGQGLQLLIRAGEGETIASLRSNREDKGTLTSPLTKATTCGRASQHIEFSTPRIEIQCVIYGDGRQNGPSTVPPMTTVAESFRYGDLDVVVSWRLPTSLREHYRENERRFFASLRCADRPDADGK